MHVPHVKIMPKDFNFILPYREEDGRWKRRWVKERAMETIDALRESDGND